MARPAAAVVPARGVRRRPAAAVEAARTLDSVPAAEIGALGLILIPKASYYNREVAIVGRPQALKVEGGQTFVEIVLCGTKDDEVLRVISGLRGRLAQLHLCGADCGKALTGETLFHGREFSQIRGDEEAWYYNLEQVVPRDEPEEDELEKLRREAALRAEEEKKPKEKPKKEKKKKAKKEKKEKAKKEEEAGSDEDSEDLERGQRPLGKVFKNTGLDPDVKRRRKMMSRARKLGKSKKKKSKKDEKTSSGTSGSDSAEESSSDGEGAGLFDSDRKVKQMARRYPGCLTASSLGEAKEALVTSSGMTWNLDKSGLPPLFTHFTRQQLAGGMSPPLLQEAVTISAAVDALLIGKVAYACDILSQRLKSLESLSHGAHWSVGRQLELVTTEAQTMAEESEALDAARRARDVEKLRGLMNRPAPARGSGHEGDGGQKGGKGKTWKGNGKGKTGDGGRGKGGDKTKEDKGGWQNKKEKQ